MQPTMPYMPAPSTPTIVNGSIPQTHAAAPRPAPSPSRGRRQSAPAPGWFTRVRARLSTIDSLTVLGAIYYTGLVSAALWGGTEAMVALWHIATPQAMFFVGLAEVGGVYLAHMADVEQRKGSKPFVIWTLATAVATGAVALQLKGHIAIGETVQAYYFAGASALGFVTYVARSVHKRRQIRRDEGKLARPTPSYGIEQWVRHPVVTMTARGLARNSDVPMSRAQSINAAKIQLGLERWIKMTVNSSSGGAKGPDGKPLPTDRRRAKAMMTVHPTDLIAAELAEVADRDTYVRWLASMLDPRVMTGAVKAPAPPSLSSSITGEPDTSGIGSGSSHEKISTRPRKGAPTVPEPRQRMAGPDVMAALRVVWQAHPDWLKKQYADHLNLSGERLRIVVRDYGTPQEQEAWKEKGS